MTSRLHGPARLRRGPQRFPTLAPPIPAPNGAVDLWATIPAINYYYTTVVDKVTGAEFELRGPAVDPGSFSSRLFGLGFVIGSVSPRPLDVDPAYRRGVLEQRRQYEEAAGCDSSILCQTPRSRISEATQSTDYAELLACRHLEAHPVDRHLYLQQFVHWLYTVGIPKGKSKVKAAATIPPETAWRMVEPLAWQWIVESAQFTDALRQWDSEAGGCGRLPHVQVFDDLRKHLKLRGFLGRAADIDHLERSFFA